MRQERRHELGGVLSRKLPVTIDHRTSEDFNPQLFFVRSAFLGIVEGVQAVMTIVTHSFIVRGLDALVSIREYQDLPVCRVTAIQTLKCATDDAA